MVIDMTNEDTMKNLKIYRKKANLTQAQLAKKIGCTRSQIGNIEIGLSDIPLSKAVLIADILKVKIADLVKE